MSLGRNQILTKNLEWVISKSLYLVFFLPSSVYLIFFREYYEFPKILVDELAGIDTLNQIFSDSFPKYTGYSSGLGILLVPFRFMTSDPYILYYCSQVINVLLIGLASIFLFKISTHYLSTTNSFLIVSAFSVWGTILYSVPRAMTESWLFLLMAAFAYLLESIFNNVKMRGIYPTIILICFTSIIHQRLFILVTFFFVIYTKLLLNKFRLTRKSLNQIMVFIGGFLIFSIVNYLICGSGFTSGLIRGFLESLPRFSISDYLKVLVGNFAILNLSSLGLFVSISYFTVMHLRNRKVKSDGSLTKVLAYLILIISLAVVTSSLFGYYLVVHGGFGETLSTVVLHSRYIDNLLPAFMTLGIVQYWKTSSSFGLIQRVLPIVISFCFVYFGMFIVNSGIVVADPIRSPFGYQLSIGRPLEIIYFQSLVIGILIIHFMWVVNYRTVILLPIVSLLMLAKPLGWDKSIAEFGWQQNHATATFINDQALTKKYLENSCANLDLRSTDSWWTRESIRYWLQIPVIPNTDKTCQYLVTDYTIPGARPLFIEQQATDIYVYATEG